MVKLAGRLSGSVFQVAVVQGKIWVFQLVVVHGKIWVFWALVLRNIATRGVNAVVSGQIVWKKICRRIDTVVYCKVVVVVAVVWKKISRRINAVVATCKTRFWICCCNDARVRCCH